MILRLLRTTFYSLLSTASYVFITFQRLVPLVREYYKWNIKFDLDAENLLYNTIAP